MSLLHSPYILWHGLHIRASGITSTAGEQCVVSGAAGVSLEPCLLAIAAGDGREVFQMDKERPKRATVHWQVLVAS